MIVCNGLTKRFPQRIAVDQISLAVEPGEICAVLGPNGAGKSTLIRMLCGLMRPDAGTALVAGFDPAARSLAFRRAIGVVPDQLALLPELTIEEQVSLCGPIYGFDGYVTKKRTEELLRLLGIWDTRQTLARECSHGMRKKTALAMALLHSPAVLILDEPFEGVDPAGAETIRTLLWSASRRGISILLTSHILSLVDRISDRVVMIRAGQVVWDSPVSPESRQTAEQIYFQLVEPPVYGDLEWLQSSR